MFRRTLTREIRILTSHRIYLWGILLVPLLMSVFFVTMLRDGLPHHVPASLVDLDRTAMSRKVASSLDAGDMVDIAYCDESFHSAMQRMQRGEIYGFFLIPSGFGSDALAGRTPTLSYYTNMTYYVPGTLAFKGFKTMAVTTSGGIVQTTLISTGAVGEQTVSTLLQPVVVDTHAPGNPWLNYSYYLSSSFIPGVLQLMILLMTVWAVCHEIKHRTSVQWLRSAGGSVVTAVCAKLLPQTLLFTLVTWWTQALTFGFCHFPLNGPLWHMLLAALLFVMASQGFALLICCALPNLRLALSVTSLLGILSFSLAAFSFPVPSMYGALGIFSYILPVRHYFLIYIDTALNGIPLYYSRWYFVALILISLAGFALLPRLRRRALNPVYVP